MLRESDVVSSVCRYLKERGYKITQELTETEKGDDIVAIAGDGRNCLIEAKGETSSKRESRKYGKAFSSSQVGVHVAKAFYKAVEMSERNSRMCKVGIALPATQEHKKRIEKIAKTLEQLSIEVFWVGRNRSVDVHGNWR